MSFEGNHIYKVQLYKFTYLTWVKWCHSEEKHMKGNLCQLCVGGVASSWLIDALNRMEKQMMQNPCSTSSYFQLYSPYIIHSRKSG